MANSRQAHIVIKAEDLPYVREELERLTVEVDTLDEHLGEAYHALQRLRLSFCVASGLITAWMSGEAVAARGWDGLIFAAAALMWGRHTVWALLTYWKARAK